MFFFRTAIQEFEQNLNVVQDVVQQAQAVPKPVLFLESVGNWPLCRTSKCKSLGRYAVYAEAHSLLQVQKFQ